MKLDNNALNEIRNSLDIVDVISNYVKLTARGKNYFGVCPFHDDHSPSMSVSPERQIYTCFSCGATGNVFKFLQDFKNITFMEAVKECADMAGIPIEIGGINNKKNKYQDLYDMYELSFKFYQNNLNTQMGKKARDYLHARSLDDNTIKEFGIGLSLKDSDMLTKLLKSKNYDDKLLIRSGLVNDNGFDLYDVYRNRIMFPLYDLNGKVVGFNGRIYNGENDSKYVNSKETDIFKKRELLYNYHRAREEVRKTHSIIIMEGPMDIIRAYTVGIKNCVAALGTAFGSEQAMLVRKLSDNVVLCFDGDSAGLKATKAAIIELSKVGITPKIVRLENNSDPDEYILKNGGQAFENKIKSAMNVMEFKESELKSEYDLTKPLDMSKYINEMMDEINHMEDPILQEVTLNKLSRETDVDINLLKSKLNKPVAPKIEVKPKVKVKLDKYVKSERNLIYYMLLSTDVIKMYQKKITHMPTDTYRHLAFQINQFYKDNGYMSVADLITYLDTDLESIKAIGEITSLNLPSEINFELIDDYLNNIREYNEKEQAKSYKVKIKNELDYNKKLEIAKKALELKMRREENDR